MRVRMVETRRAAPDNVRTQIYEAGKSYDVPDELARMWFASGRAIEDKAIDVAPETKVRGRKKIDSAPETK